MSCNQAKNASVIHTRLHFGLVIGAILQEHLGLPLIYFLHAPRLSGSDAWLARSLRCTLQHGAFEHPAWEAQVILLMNTLLVLTFCAVAHASRSGLQEIHKEGTAVPDGDGNPEQAAVPGAPKDLPGSTAREPLALPRSWQGFRLQWQPHWSLCPTFVHLRVHTKETFYSKCGKTPLESLNPRTWVWWTGRGSGKAV